MATKTTERDRGAALVEFALIAPVLVSILLGIVTGGFALAAKNSTTNAAREGARLGATLINDSDWADSVEGRVVDLAGGDLEASEVCVELVEADGTPVQGDTSATCSFWDERPTIPASADGCVVRVWTETSATLNALFFSRDLTLESQSLGLYERDGCP